MCYIGARAFGTCPLLTEINYNGTKAEFDAILRSNWNDESSITKVICTDGEINLSE